MAYNPYNLSRVAQPAAPGPTTGRYALSRPANLTANGQEAEQQNVRGLQTGQFADVQSAAAATQRANALRSTQGLQAARGTVARSGDLSPEAALRAQDQAFAASSAENLNADNQVSQLQRQYRQDALNRAGSIEDKAVTGANNERNYQTDADRYAQDQSWKGYDANVSEENRLFGQNNTLSQQDRAQGNVDREYGANRQDTAFNQGLARDQFGANRADAADNRNRYDLSRGDANNQFNQQFGASRQDAAFNQGLAKDQFNANRSDTAWNQSNTVGQQADARNRYDLSRGDANSQFAQTYGANRQDAGFQQNLQTQEFGANRADTAWNQGNTQAQQADSRSRYDLSRGDANNQFSQTFGANRADAATAAGQFQQQFGANRADAATAKDQFNQTFGANRADAAWNQGNTEAQQADSRSRYDLSRGDANAQFGQTMDQRNSEFGVTSGQNQQQINNQASQFNQNYDAGRTDAADSRSRYDLSRGDANAQFDKTFDASRSDAKYAQDYQTGRDQVADSRYGQQYADQRGDIAYDRTKGNAMAAIDNIADPKAKQAAYNAYMNGEDVSKFITGTLYDSTGGLKGGAQSPYASASPGTQAAAAKIDELRSYYPQKTDAELADMANQERQQDRAVERAPVDTATKTAAAEEAKQRLANGAPQPGDFDTLPSVNPQAIPLGIFTNEWMAKNTTGGWTKIGGTPYKIVKGGNNRPGSAEGDYAILQDKDGGTKYLLKDGTISPTEPKPYQMPIKFMSGRI